MTLERFRALIRSLRAFGVPAGQPMSEGRFRQLREAWRYMLQNSPQPNAIYRGRYVVIMTKGEAMDLNLPCPDYIPGYATAPFLIGDPVYDETAAGSIRLSLTQMDRWMDPSMWETRIVYEPRISLERG